MSASRNPSLPPRARRQPTSYTIHGVTLIDDYAWLRAANWREVMHDPEQLAADIRTYLEAENTYTEAHMAAIAGLRQTLVAEIRGRMTERDASVPAPDGAWVYYTLFRAAGQHPIFCRAPRNQWLRDHDDLAATGDPLPGEQLLLDGDAKAQGYTYFRFGAVEHSRDHMRLAFALDTSGAETYTLHVHEMATGAEVQAPIHHTAGDIFFYD